MPIRCREFRHRSWEEACAGAETFANDLGPERVVSVSHVSEPPHARVFVWHVERDEEDGRSIEPRARA